MAGDWLKLECCTPEKPEVLSITIKMGWDDPDLAVGKLFKMWRWFDQHTEEGNAASVSESLLDRIIGVSGFAKAVESVGWLVINEDGISLPNFDRHNGKTAKKRAMTAKRVAKHAENKGANAKPNKKLTQGALPREEKRREEENITLNPKHTRAGEFAVFPVDNFEPSPEDIEYCESMELHEPLDLITMHFRIHHSEAKTKTNQAAWSRLYQGWVEKNRMPPPRELEG